MKKQPKFINRSFGPAALLKDEIAAFLDGIAKDATKEEIQAFKDAANWLARLAVHPEDMRKDAAAFARFYAKHTRFVLEFMVAMRRAAFAKSKGEQWLHSFDAMARQQEKDETLLPDLRKLGVGSNQLRTARVKLRRRLQRG